MFAKITLESIAKQCHEANRQYCNSIGDYSQKPWEEAPQWQKDSALKGVQAHIDSGLTMTPEDSHKSWMEEKLADGWKYGPIKDPEKKEHPCMVPYEELPLQQRLKDQIFTSTVHILAPHLGK